MTNILDRLHPSQTLFLSLFFAKREAKKPPLKKEEVNMATVETRKTTTRKYNKPLINMLGYVYLSTKTSTVLLF